MRKIKDININNITDNDIRNVLYSIERKEYNEVDYLVCFGSHAKEFLNERLDKLIEILKNKNISKIILSGGVGVNGNFNEAEYMKEYLLNNNINENKLLIENASTTTEENIVNVFEILKGDANLKNKKILLLTHEPHLRRILMEIKKWYPKYVLNLYCEYPDNSVISFKNLINDGNLRNLAEKEIKKIISFIDKGIIDNEYI